MIDVDVTKKINSFILKARMEDEGIICVTGHNGSGKTTLLNIVAGFIKQDSGHVIVSGKDVSTLPPEERGVVYVAQDSFIPSLTVDKHLNFALKLRKGMRSTEELVNVKQKFSINFSGKMKELSLGQRERVAIATAVLRKPSVLLIDEALSNISDKEAFIKSLIDVRRSYGFDLVFTTQDQEDSAYADHHYVMSKGTLIKRF
ncbi:MAG: ATPase, T2SS/T4P/T4SS family [Thermoplasmatales archaeon]